MPLKRVNRLTEISQNNFSDVSAFIHVGDMGYNFFNEAGKRGDNYMNVVQKFTATMPYMVTAGNHEVFGNFSNFNSLTETREKYSFQIFASEWNLRKYQMFFLAMKAWIS